MKNMLFVLFYTAAAFAFSAGAEAVLLPLLRKLKAGQAIREDGPQAHLAKAGTPTMGGIAMVFAVPAALLLGFALRIGFVSNVYAKPEALQRVGLHLLGPALVMLAYGAIGFVDDYIKVTKKHNEGLTPKQKLTLQILAALIFAVMEVKGGKEMIFPFVGRFIMPAWLAIPFEVFVIVAMTNAVNLTDGLDGLASSVTAVCSAFFALVFASVSGSASFNAAAICGACLGFLVFNHYPATVFMGDTGSLALGGGLAAMAASAGAEWFLPIAGLVYVAEALSVIIQVYVFKTQNGRRFFRMAPLHHHFELGGWKETKVVWMFVLAAAVSCLVALAGFCVAVA